ncbi:hypothetical protein O6H91_10G062700 [Diphasiastrum complanatum]|uniref:Uncharacterized protein n=1 Tax=Diphasiastrum complanatum TaxID=34168 RepID=A0ACC2CHP1_DIPCM|nr:hypothetical protein O6H91_10G062700 [Diphasiastrum complanatum]
MAAAGARIVAFALTIEASVLYGYAAARASHKLHTESICSGEESSHNQRNNSKSRSDAIQKADHHPNSVVVVAPPFDGLNIFETITLTRPFRS